MCQVAAWRCAVDSTGRCSVISAGLELGAVRVALSRLDRRCCVSTQAQVHAAWDRGVRPERRSKELLNLRRSEVVLVKQEDYDKAFKVCVWGGGSGAHALNRSLNVIKRAGCGIRCRMCVL